MRTIRWNNGEIDVYYDFSPAEKETNFDGHFRIYAVKYKGVDITELFDKYDFNNMEDKILYE